MIIVFYFVVFVVIIIISLRFYIFRILLSCFYKYFFFQFFLGGGFCSSSKYSDGYATVIFKRLKHLSQLMPVLYSQLPLRWEVVAFRIWFFCFIRVYVCLCLYAQRECVSFGRVAVRAECLCVVYRLGALCLCSLSGTHFHVP